MQQQVKAPTGPAFASRVIEWQRSHGRHALPWQGTRDPYRVWLSEVMLQQTQVATVLGYYARFLERFPDVATLAAASLDDVFALWSGLGYYSRARNLHRCAQTVVAEHGGQFPRTSTALATLPGIGRSTAAAIAAFCFGERVAILDGNVKRVLARVVGFGGDLADAGPQRELWDIATGLLPAERGEHASHPHGADIAAYTQGLMDLGATVCLQRAPLCASCPVAGLCVAAATDTVLHYPVKRRRVERGRREHLWLWLRRGSSIWLERRPVRGVWAGLWSLPEFESETAFVEASCVWPGRLETLPTFTHVLTHLDWTLHPRRWTLPERTSRDHLDAVVRRWPSGHWFELDEALGLGLPAPLRRLLTDPAVGA